ncbi:MULTISPECIES: hypothetical protein [Laceyella]|jgi:hypothetical protein|uniref:YqzM family protein n=2 Tax=Laceyella TaxID=292635 RepID=A0AA46ADW1_9BACL|nr:MULTISPECIES: hypothetical protein [Laceyella]PRZ13522.1 hypothetical protein CLV36_10819 [Laceyella sediminis]SMP08416.1 hypothetical protein SAMN06265361_10219 [Laceyella tengchongensis]
MEKKFVDTSHQDNEFIDFMVSAGVVTALFMGIFVVATAVQLMM